LDNKVFDSPTEFKLHAAVSFFRSYQFISKSRNSQHFMKPESSLPHSQQPYRKPH